MRSSSAPCEWVRVGEALVVEVVQQPGGAPRLELVADSSRYRCSAYQADGSLDRAAVLAQRVRLGPLAQQRPRLVPGGLASVGHDGGSSDKGRTAPSDLANGRERGSPRDCCDSHG